jgi:hypothetical protein
MVIAITIAAIIQPAAIHRPPTSPVCFYLVQQTMALTLDSVSAPRSGRLDRLLQTRRPSDYRAPSPLRVSGSSTDSAERTSYQPR